MIKLNKILKEKTGVQSSMFYTPESGPKTEWTKNELNKLADIRFANINNKDYPNFVNAFITSATYVGKELSSEEIDILNNDYSDFVHEKLFEKLLINRGK